MPVSRLLCMRASPEDILGMAFFARVVEARSFSDAARSLGVSKSAVSARVSRLERSLGVRLLHRTTRRLALTADGVARVIAELREKFEWVICDSPAGIERGATLAMRHADAAVIVTNPEVSSVRDSDRIIGLLDSKTEKAEKGERVDKHLLITRYDLNRATRGDMMSVCSSSARSAMRST